MTGPVRQQLEFHFPPVVMSRGDGTYVVKPGKPVVMEAEISADEAAVILRRSAFTVYRYVREGLLTGKQAKPGARYRLLRREVEDLAARTSTGE
jgi:hypothetical protein